MKPKPGDPILSFDTPADWEAWLEEHHASAGCIWIKFAKKGGNATSIGFADALDGALCFGWIDGQRAALDDDWFLQRFTPRRPKSKWSKVNTQKVAKLIADKRMRPAGKAQIDAAKADGRWDAAYDPPSKVKVPPDLQKALDANPQAAAFFATLSGSNRYAILYRVHDAKRAETRARRIKQFVEMLAEGRTLH